LTGDSEFLYQDRSTSSVMRYNAATSTETVLISNSALVSLNKSSMTDRLKVSSVKRGWEGE